MTVTTYPDLGLQTHYEPLIGGTFRSITSETFPAINPSTGDVLAVITRSGKEEVNAAVAAAKTAFPAWSSTTPEARATLLHRLADWVEENTTRLAMIDALDIGRTIFETPMDHAHGARQYRFFASAIVTHDGWHTSVPGGHAIAKRESLGVVGQIIPWNVPGIMVGFKLAPALAAGNTVVLKPDENASLSTLELCRAAAEIFPPGVVNVVPGYGEEAGAALTAHPDVIKLAFTGSAEVGRIVAHAGAERLIPVSLELGGKSPNIVFPDIEDMDAVVDNAAFAVGICNGQACLAGTRLFVHDAIYDEFVGKLASAFERLTIGDPTDIRSRLGCLVSSTQGERVLRYLDAGKREANLITGGARRQVDGHSNGYFIEPTLFESNNHALIDREEIFGPVASVIRWSDRDEMIRMANDTTYGLASGIYTSNLKNALDTADRLQAGSVWVNQYFNLHDGSPFGGYKQSGVGREYSKETLDMYTQLKTIMVMKDQFPAFFVPQN